MEKTIFYDISEFRNKMGYSNNIEEMFLKSLEECIEKASALQRIINCIVTNDFNNKDYNSALQNLREELADNLIADTGLINSLNWDIETLVKEKMKSDIIKKGVKK